MPRSGKTRRLWLHIKIFKPKGVRKKQAINTLIDAIERGDYRYPKKWRVALGWRNSPYGQMKWGEFTAEMRKSFQSSPGWDEAVLDYLERRS
jgi:hypothetical protein